MHSKLWRFLGAIMVFCAMVMVCSWYFHLPKDPWWHAGGGLLIIFGTFGSVMAAIHLGVDLMED